MTLDSNAWLNLCSGKLLGKGIGSPQSARQYSFCVILSMAWLASPLVVLIISVAIIISIVGNGVHLAILILSNTVYLYGNARWVFFPHLFGNFSSLSFNEKTCVAISNCCCCWHESFEKGQQQLFGWSYEFEVGYLFTQTTPFLCQFQTQSLMCLVWV